MLPPLKGVTTLSVPDQKLRTAERTILLSQVFTFHISLTSASNYITPVEAYCTPWVPWVPPAEALPTWFLVSVKGSLSSHQWSDGTTLCLFRQVQTVLIIELRCLNLILSQKSCSMLLFQWVIAHNLLNIVSNNTKSIADLRCTISEL